ncbi:MAG: hypothetical protein ABIL09_23545 [Gemmatimonadota bacterium]
MKRLGPLLLLAAACGVIDRNNPADPGVGDSGVQLVASFPGPAGGVPVGLVEEVRYTVTAADLDSVTGTLNLVAAQAQALVTGVSAGTGRVFRVDAFDRDHIRTYSGIDTVDLAGAGPLTVRLDLVRLTGTVELSSLLPPEIASLEVAIVADGDTLRSTFEVQNAALNERITTVPTGSDVQVVLSGSDTEGQVRLRRTVLADVRAELVARVVLDVEAGAAQVTALFPDYLPAVAIDRFSDAAATFYRRSDRPSLPGPDKPIDFDRLFLFSGLGPNGEQVQFYHLDVQPADPAPVYLLVDRRGDPISGQLAIFDQIPGDSTYNDLRQVWEVQVTDRDFRANSITSLQAILDLELEPVATGRIWNCAMAPPGSQATHRYGAADVTSLQAGWYRDQIVRYFLFEGEGSSAQVAFESGEISAPLMYAFLDNDRDVTDGFAVGEPGATHNVFTRLPGQEGYAPLWVLRVLRLQVFDRVRDVATAQDQERGEDNVVELETILQVNAPIVGVGPRASGG